MSKFSIKLKITLWYMGLMISLVSLFLIIIFYISENIIHSNEYKRLKHTVEYSFNEIKYKNGELLIDNDLQTKIDTIQISVYNKNFEFIYGDNPLNFDYEDTFSENGSIKTVRHEKEKWYVYELKKEYPGYGNVWVRGTLTSVGASRAIETIIFISLIGFPFFLIFAGISGYVVTKNAFKPINRIRSAAERINEGNDLSQRIDLGTGTDEIYTLANTFDTMFDRLQGSFENEVQFTSDVSHELRTPIAVIMSQAEFGKNDAVSLEEGKKSFDIILNETKRMSQLVAQLLTLSRMDRGHQKLNLEYVSIGELAEIAIDSQRENARFKDINIEENISLDSYASVDETMIIRVFINIISNAITYGKYGGNILVEVKKDKDKIISKISDNGIGISEEHINKIWTRFYQVDSSRSNNNTGLGLSIVKGIIKAHNGKIYVRSAPDQGTTFTFILPENNISSRENI